MRTLRPPRPVQDNHNVSYQGSSTVYPSVSRPVYARFYQIDTPIISILPSPRFYSQIVDDNGSIPLLNVTISQTILLSLNLDTNIDQSMLLIDGIIGYSIVLA